MTEPVVFAPKFVRDVARFVTSHGAAAVDLRRRFHIGHDKARQILQVLENHGIVGPAQENKARDVLVTRAQLDEVLGSLPGGDQS